MIVINLHKENTIKWKFENTTEIESALFVIEFQNGILSKCKCEISDSEIIVTIPESSKIFKPNIEASCYLEINFKNKTTKQLERERIIFRGEMSTAEFQTVLDSSNKKVLKLNKQNVITRVKN